MSYLVHLWGLAMNPELQRIFDSVPEDEPRSRLEPYRELILRWRRQGRSYRRIRELLVEHFGANIGKSALHKFVQRRSCPRKNQPEAELQAEPAQTKSAPTKLSSGEVANQRALIQHLRNKPVIVREVRKRFVYNPDEPLILDKHKQES
jgi:hypothetical protein